MAEYNPADVLHDELIDQYEDDLACTWCNGEGDCYDGSDPLGDCPDWIHPCHACRGTGRRKDQTVF